MALKAHLEKPKTPVYPNEQRRSERRALFLETKGFLPGGLEANVVVHNASIGGLLLETATPLSVGEKLELDLPEAGSVQATVVWESGSLFGCAFNQPLAKKALAAAQLRSDPAAEAVGPELDAALEPLGMKLNRLRRERGLTLAQVAAVLGVSKPTVWAWEKGKARPLPDRIDAIAKALGVDAQQLEQPVCEEQQSAVVQESRLRIATAYATHPSRIKIMIEV